MEIVLAFCLIYVILSALEIIASWLLLILFDTSVNMVHKLVYKFNQFRSLITQETIKFGPTAFTSRGHTDLSSKAFLFIHCPFNSG